MGDNLRFYDLADGEYKEASSDEPFPMRIDEGQGPLPPIAGETRSLTVQIPGIVTGAAYADGDCLGTIMEFPGLLRSNKRSGLIHTVTYFDMSDQGVQVDIHFFNRSILSPGADNAAFTPTDAELMAYIGTAQMAAFSNFGANQISGGAYYLAVPPQAGTSIFGHAVARGAQTISAGNLPLVRLVFLPD